MKRVRPLAYTDHELDPRDLKRNLALLPMPQGHQDDIARWADDQGWSLAATWWAAGIWVHKKRYQNGGVPPIHYPYFRSIVLNHTTADAVDE